MDCSEVHPPYRWSTPFAHDFWRSNRSEDACVAPNYQQKTHDQDHYPPRLPLHSRHTIATRQTPTMLVPNLHIHAATSAQVAAYKDAVTTEAWHDEWEAEPDDFGSSRPLLLLNRPANIDLESHVRRTKFVQLCHWDQFHEPDGMIAQRLETEKRIREKRQLLGHVSAEQDKRRRNVQLVARNAKVIDLTEDDAVEGRKFQSYVGFNNAENRAPEYIAHPWRF